MNRSAYLIFNPVAGQGDPEQNLQKIQELLSPEIDLEIQLTSEEVDADRLAREAIAKNVEMVIAAGGDGTLSAVAEELIGTQIPLGIIALGTANALAAALGVPDTLEEAAQTILDGLTKEIDAARCNGKSMVLLAGVGFEAETVEKADRQVKNRWGMLAYILSGIQQLQEFDTFEAEIETDDKIVTVSAVAITIANAAPPTSILAQGPAGIIFDDGLLDITIVAPTNRTAAVAASYHLLQTALKEEATERDDIGYLRAKRVKVSTEPPQKVVVDGELIGDTPIEVECIPKGLTVFVPATQAVQPVEKLEGLPNVKIELKD
jgi:YegS/Rv2252/BmrU family lipid kinase